ncbi:helix-turn-helix transcriptional regulator [Salinimicrobium flavum]|uniref:Helix-turn-helix transcriptional regulator n=1 Tax=Salinimicrobium flavum TaxID=1737065 RepID=A0ABW5IYT4_9FLAO
MSGKISLQRHRAIISKLRRSPLNFDQLQDYLQLQSDISGDRLTCSLRTFQRDMEQINILYHIEIKYNPSQKVYEIVYDENEDHNERLMEAFEVYNALNIANTYSNQVIVEKRKPLGTDHLYGLLHAIKNRLQVSFDYEKYSENDSRRRTVEPIAIKEARNRWYLLAREAEGISVKSFGLDRISELELSHRKFEAIEYDVEKEYRHSFGIINGIDVSPQNIVLSFTPTEGKYVKSLPLHHSQKLVKETTKETVFSYNLIPTYDLRMEILSYGDQVKVIEPESFREEVKKQLEAALKLYR